MVTRGKQAGFPEKLADHADRADFGFGLAVDKVAARIDYAQPVGRSDPVTQQRCREHSR